MLSSCGGCEPKATTDRTVDVETLRPCAEIAKGWADRARIDQSAHGDRRDGLERLGASQALDQLAADLEATAIALGSGAGGETDDE